MSVLFMIGRGEEEESVVDLLFDIEKITERPNYEIASESGLILSSCGYDSIKWQNSLGSDLDTYKVIMK